MVAEWGDCSTAASNGDGNTSSKCYNIRSVANHNIQDSTNSVPCYTSTNKQVACDLNIIESSIGETTDVAKPVRCSNSPDFCQLQFTGHATCITSCLRQLAMEDGYHDMVLLCGGKKIVAHKLVLSSASSFLKAILENSSEWSPAVVSVEGVGWTVMQLLLQYIYLGETIVPGHLLSEVVAAGEALGVTGLKDVKEFISEAQTDPDDNRQEDCSAPSASKCALETREIHDSSTNVLKSNGNSLATTESDDLIKSCQSSPQLHGKKRRRRTSCPSLAEDCEAKKFKCTTDEDKFNSDGSDQSFIDSNEEIEVGSPPHILSNLSSTVTQESDSAAAASTQNDNHATGGSSCNSTVKPYASSSNTTLETCTAATSILHSAEQSVKKPGPWHQEAGNVTEASETIEIKNDSLGLPTNLNHQGVTGRTASNCVSYSFQLEDGPLTANVHPRYSGIGCSYPAGPKQESPSDHTEPSNISLSCLASTGKQVQKASLHTFRDSLNQSGHVRGGGDASSTLSALVENMRAAQTLSNGSGETAGRTLNMRNHGDDMVKAEVTKRSSDYIKENILGLGTDLPAAKLLKKQHLPSGSNSVASPLAQLLNVGEKLTPNYSASLNSMLMAAGRAGTTSSAGTALGVHREGVIQGSSNGVNAGNISSGYHKTEHMNGYSEEQSVGNNMNDKNGTRNDDRSSQNFGDEIKAEFNKQNCYLPMDSREEFVSNTSDPFNSHPPMFAAADADINYFQKLGNLPASALFNKKSDVSAFLSSLVSNGRFDQLNYMYQKDESGKTRPEHQSNPRETATASWDYLKNSASNDTPPVDEDVKRLLLPRQQPNGAGSGPSDSSRGSCPEPVTRPTNDAEESKPQQHRFATQEEIDAALDVYQRKLAFHEPRPCPSCQRMYRDAATLRTHINIMHTPGTEPFLCSCGFLFRTKYEMYHHKKNGHYATSQPKL